MKPQDVKSLSAFIRTFNPVAKIVETQRSRVPLTDVVNSRAFSMQRAEQMKGWLARARGDVQPESEECASTPCRTAVARTLFSSSRRYGISSFVYRARRPFHPKRLHSIIGALDKKGTFDGVLRSKVSGGPIKAFNVAKRNALGFFVFPLKPLLGVLLDGDEQ
jgi:G3E family GTPase